MRPGHLPTQLKILLVGALVAAGLGGAFAVWQSPQSVALRLRVPGPGHPLSATETPSPTARPVVSPSPTGTPAVGGRLGQSARLWLTPTGAVATGPREALFSPDGGVTWAPVQLPALPTDLMVDPADAAHLVTGGDFIGISQDGGRTWTAPTTAPPVSGPYRALAISPTDPAVWFLVAQGKLLRTRDGGISWRLLSNPTNLGAPVIAAAGADEFYLAADRGVHHLVDNGTQVQALAQLPDGVSAGGIAVLRAGPSPVLLVAGSDGRAYLYSGSAWRAQDLGRVGVVASIVGGRGFAADAQHGSGAGRLSLSGDAGATWVAAAGLPADQTVEAVAAGGQGAGRLLAYLYGGDLFASADQGSTWTPLSRALRGPAPAPLPTATPPVAPTPFPTPFPTAVPTPPRTPAPTPRPTPTPAPTPTPSPVPTPTPPPTPTPTPSSRTVFAGLPTSTTS